MSTGNEDRFTSINPDELSPELQQVYKMLQRDYTKKRQEESGRVKDAEERLQAQEAQLRELSTNFEAVRDYARGVEDNNLKWQEWYKYQQEQEQAKAQLGNQTQTPKQAVPGMSATDRQLLQQANAGELSSAQLEQFEKYFLGKFGSTMQSLTDGLSKMEQKLGYSMQLNELLRTRGREFDIDPKRIVDAAVSMGTTKLDEAFEKAYSTEIEDKKKSAWLEEAKKTWEAEQKSTALEGLSRQKTETFYTRPADTPRSYEEAGQKIAEEIATNPSAAWSPS